MGDCLTKTALPCDASKPYIRLAIYTCGDGKIFVKICLRANLLQCWFLSLFGCFQRKFVIDTAPVLVS